MRFKPSSTSPSVEDSHRERRMVTSLAYYVVFCGGSNNKGCRTVIDHRSSVQALKRSRSRSARAIWSKTFISSLPVHLGKVKFRSMEYLPEARPDGSYINESKRNLHVWCSMLRASSYPKFNEQPTLGLIAGRVVIHIDKYSTWSRYRVLCAWMATGLCIL